MRADRPSSTALLITRSVLLADHAAILRPLLAPGAGAASAQLLHAAGARSRWLSRALGLRVIRKLLLGVERLVLPGITLHYLVRKRCLEDIVREALASGCRQVIVLGAGLDTLAWRLHGQWGAVQFLEIDHPATQRLKSAAWTGAQHGAGQNLALLPADLADAALAEALRGCAAFDPQRRTIVLAEGLLMYLPLRRVETLFSEIGATLRGPAALVFTFFEPRADGTPGFVRSSPLVNGWLRWRSEPFRWAASEETLSAVLRRCGWKKKRVVRAAEFRQDYLENTALAAAPLAVGEAVCVAEN